MAGFTIDDAGEGFASDVGGFLRSIETTARAVLQAAALSPGGLEKLALAEPFQRIADDGHGIRGTASLVGAESLAGTATLVEDLCEQAQQSLVRFVEEANRLRTIAETAERAAVRMREMLALEMARKPSDALSHAVTIGAELRGLAPKAPVEPPSRFVVPMPATPPSVGDDEDAFQFSAPADSPEDELSDAFREEALAAAMSVQGYLEMLAADPRDATALAALGRIFLTLKTTAATLGRDDVAQLAAVADATVAGIAVDGAAADEATLARLVRDANAMFIAADVDPVSVPETPLSPSGAAIDDELRDIFLEEAHGHAEAVARLLTQLAERPTDGPAIHDLERVSHTLKGAAATVGWTDVRSSAERLQRAVEPAILAGVVDPHQWCLWRDEAVSLFARVGLPLKLEGVQPPPSVKRKGALATMPHGHDEPRFRFVENQVEPELLEIFQSELDAMLPTLTQALKSLANPGRERRHLSEVQRSFHTLKGAAATVGLGEAATLATSVEAAADELLSLGEFPSDELVRSWSANLERISATLQKTPPAEEHVQASRAAETAPESPQANASSVSSQQGAEVSVSGVLFRQEATALMTALADATTELSSPTAATARRRLETLAHQLKGSAAVAGDAAVAELARSVQEAASTEPVEVIEKQIAQLRALLAPPAARGAPLPAALSASKRRRLPVSVPSDKDLWEAFQQECIELLDAIERGALELEAARDPRREVRELMRLVHTLKGAVNTVGLTPTGAVLHQIEDALERLVEEAILPPLREVADPLLDAQALVRRNLREAESGWVEVPGLDSSRSETVSARGTSPSHDRGPQAARDASIESIESRGSERSADAEDRAFVRVPTARLDSLMDLAGELVVSRSRLATRVGNLRAVHSDLSRTGARLVELVESFREEYEFADLDGRSNAQPMALAAGAESEAFGALELDRYEDIHILSRSLAEIDGDLAEALRRADAEVAGFSDDADSFGGIVGGIQSEVTRSRLVPLDLLFARLRLPIRDAATRERKDVAVSIEGGDVMLDKTMVDGLLAPMLHLVRNAVAHGIETAVARQQAGKPAKGTIRLIGRQEAGQIVIEVSDDGGGLDLEALRARGAQMGLLPADADLNDQAVRNLIFANGLSTKKGAGDVSGRGIGGDVARRSIERMNGTIRVETVRGQGTQFTTSLPVTLAIARALFVKCGQHRFALPLHFAQHVIGAGDERLVESGTGQRVLSNGLLLPVRDLSDILGVRSSGTQGAVLLLRAGQQELALRVDEVLGQDDIVLKSLGELLQGHQRFAGVTLRGDGGLVLVLDVPALADAQGSRARALPVAQERRPRDDGEKGEVAAAPAPSARTRVLFVDDSLSVRRAAEKLLEGLNCDVTLAIDGVDGLAKLRGATFDIVFTDLEMPRMNGYDLIREVRFIPERADLPVVVVSSRSGQKHQGQAKQLGATDYLTKPFSVEMLKDALARWVKR